MTGPEVVRTLMSTAVGYVRWTQTVPMLVAWTFAWGALAAFALANFQETGMPIAAAAVELWEQHAWLPRMDTSGMTAADGSLHIETEDIRGLVLSVWGVLAGALYLLSILIGLVWPDRKPWRLRTKLQIAAGLGAATFAAYAWIWTRSAETFHGSTLAWLGVFLVLSGFPVVVSAYSLTVGTVLDTAQGRAGAPTAPVGASDARSTALLLLLLALALALVPALVTDVRERTLLLADLRSGAARPLGARGSGPNESRDLGTLIALGADTALMAAMSNQRLLLHQDRIIATLAADHALVVAAGTRLIGADSAGRRTSMA